MGSLSRTAAACQPPSLPAASRSFTAVPNELLDHLVDWELTHLDLALYLTLLRYRWRDGQDPIPWVATLSDRLGVSGRTIQRAMRRLEDAGLVEIEARFTAVGDHTSNVYHPLLVADVATSGSGRHEGGDTGDTTPDVTGVAPKKNTRVRKNPDGRTSTDRLRPSPLEPGRCFGCGGPHETSVCPRYGGLINW